MHTSELKRKLSDKLLGGLSFNELAFNLGEQEVCVVALCYRN